MRRGIDPWWPVVDAAAERPAGRPAMSHSGSLTTVGGHEIRVWRAKRESPRTLAEEADDLGESTHRQFGSPFGFGLSVAPATTGPSSRILPVFSP